MADNDGEQKKDSRDGPVNDPKIRISPCCSQGRKTGQIILGLVWIRSDYVSA